MGEAIAKLGWPRDTYVVSTKLFWGIDESVNMRNTLNRKYLLQAIDGSLERLGLDFVDLVFCHRPDPETPIEETVWAMHDIVGVRQGPLLGDIGVAGRRDPDGCEIADRHHLRKPVDGAAPVQPARPGQGGAGVRPPLRRLGLGLTTWSPLASGLLTGKYLDGVPEGSRAALPGYEWLRAWLTDPERNRKVRGADSRRRRARLHAGAAGHRLVRREPARVDRDHRRQPGRAGAREPRCARGHRPPDARRPRPIDAIF